MPAYGTTSKQRLGTCHQDLETIFHYVIQILDHSVVFGLRTAEEQNELYKKGRVYINGKWVIAERNNVVTHKDGYAKVSNHQSGNAIDVVPYPEMWKAGDAKFFELAGVVKATAFLLKKYGDIHHEIDWGYDLWGWDLAHFQLKPL